MRNLIARFAGNPASKELSMNSSLERRIALEGSYNFRDLGGYRTTDGREVRWRRLFRSDALHRQTDEDISIVQEMGLRTLIDLRTRKEVEEGGLGALHAVESMLHRHTPFTETISDVVSLGDMRDLGKLYLDTLDRAPACLQEVFQILADEEHYPAVIHCAAGKDRTGITAGIVLRALGIPDDQIVADYALTDGYLSVHIARLRAMRLGSFYDQVPPELLRADPETLLGALAAIDDRHGSTTAFWPRSESTKRRSIDFATTC
jgi:protein-tyrosine phosphatase